MSYQHISNGGVTTVDCQKQVRSWRLLRYLIALLIPTCHSSFTQQAQPTKPTKTPHPHHHSSCAPYCTSRTIGTIFGFRRGKVSLCIQTSSNPLLLLLELPVPTSYLAREMQGGALRIALECTGTSAAGLNNNNKVHPAEQRPSALLTSTPSWTMYCNGRKVGYAVRKRPSEGDVEALRLMGSVVVGAGIISGKEVKKEDDELMYLRAKFHRVCGSSEAESFHLIDPDGTIGQELSIFFFCSGS